VTVVGRAAPLAAEREARPDDEREADRHRDLARLLEARRIAALRHLEPDLLHRLLEQQPVLAQTQRLDRRAEHLDAVALERAALGERDRQVDAGLPADRRQQSVRTLLLQDPLDRL